MKVRSLVSTALFLSLVALGAACGDDTGGDTSSGGEDGSDGSDGTESTTSGSSEETCDSRHECLNGACECTTPGKEGTSCPDADACETACEVCTS